MKTEKDYTVTPKEEVFCREYIRLCSLSEASLSAGYSKARGFALINEERIQERIKQLEKIAGESQVIRGLKRLAFSSINDCLALIVKGDQLSEEEIAKLDLFLVSGVKQGKSGGLELDFYSRQQALDLLLQQEEKKTKNNAVDFIAALGKSAKDVNKGDENLE